MSFIHLSCVIFCFKGLYCHFPNVLSKIITYSQIPMKFEPSTSLICYHSANPLGSAIKKCM